MAKNETRRIKPSDLLDDEESYHSLKGIANYAPANADYSLTAIDASYTDWKTAQQQEAQAAADYETKRDNTVAKSWAFHNKVLGSKDQVVAQFGRNSTEVQAIGLKRSSEYKARKRSSKTTKE
ncbi:MAG: hypothetical protein WCB68_10335 [Pyrinomonadaceae bacterium]